MAFQPFGHWPFFSFLILYTVGRTPWMGDRLVARPLPTHRTTQIQNKCTQTSMPWVGFEPTIPVFERAKTVHASDDAATVIGFIPLSIYLFNQSSIHQFFYPTIQWSLQLPSIANHPLIYSSMHVFTCHASIHSHRSPVLLNMCSQKIQGDNTPAEAYYAVPIWFLYITPTSQIVSVHACHVTSE
jgi:hypothetical protein